MNKKNSWLDLAEYASLVGLGVGSVASFVTAQLLYTSAPLSMLVLLNLANRRRLQQASEQATAIALHDIDHRLTKHVELFNQQIAALPTPETLGGLKKSLLIKNREVLEKLSSEISKLQQDMQQRFSTIERQVQDSLPHEVAQLQSQYAQLCDSLAQVTSQLNQVSSSTRVDGLEQAIAQIKSDTLQVRANLQTLNDQTKPALTSLQDQINHLNRQFQKLPPPFDSTALKREVEELIRVVADLVPKRDWSSLVNEMKSLHQQQESHAQAEEVLRRKIQDLNQQVQTRPAKSSLTSLQNQINHLNRQFQKLPPPFDPSSLKLEIAELMKLVSDRVPKRDWSALAAQIKALQQQQEFQAKVEKTLQHELQLLNQQLATIADGSPKRLENRSASLPVNSPVHRSVDRPIENSEADRLPEAITIPLSEPSLVVQAAIAPPPQQQEFQARIEDVLHRELSQINEQVQQLPSSPQLQAQIRDTLWRELQEVNRQLQAFPSEPRYELVFDFKSGQIPSGQGENAISHSRAVLEAALEQAQQRLIWILPWSTQCELDDSLMQKLEAFLRKGRSLEIGWCHLADREEDRFLSSMHQRWSVNPTKRANLQRTLHRLLKLKQAYSDRLQFKILGTRENFLVCDRSFAVLGMDDALSSFTIFPDLELKLRTTDPEVIQDLTDRFDHPVLNSNDVAAYWNRAVTLADLGDKDGAIADLNHILAINPQDSVTLNFRGVVRYDMTDREGAIADFAESIRLNPIQVSAYCNRGFAMSELGDQLAAISDYSLAIQNDPEAAIGYFYRGLACQKFGDPQGAVTDYSEAIRLVPDAAIAYYYRALTYQKIEYLRDAIADFETAAQLFTAQGKRTNAQKALASLNKARQMVAYTPPELNDVEQSEVDPDEVTQVLAASPGIVIEPPAEESQNGKAIDEPVAIENDIKPLSEKLNRPNRAYQAGSDTLADFFQSLGEGISLNGHSTLEQLEADSTEIASPALPPDPLEVAEPAEPSLSETLNDVSYRVGADVPPAVHGLELGGTLADFFTDEPDVAANGHSERANPPSNFHAEQGGMPGENKGHSEIPMSETLADFCNRSWW